MEMIEPIEVLVDVNCKKKYFKDMMIVAKRVAMPIQAARTLLESKGIDPQQVGADSDAMTYQTLLNRNRNNYDTKDEYVTLYYVEYRKFYVNKTTLSQVNGVKVPEEYVKQEPKLNEETYTFFNCLYHKTLGAITHEINSYKQFSYTPYYNQQSRLRLFPKMHSEFFWVLQDVNNIGKTLMLDNARQQNIIRLFIGEQLGKQFGDKVLQRFMRIGGVLTVNLSLIHI